MDEVPRTVLEVADHLTCARRRLRRRSSRTTHPPTITSSSYLNELLKLNSGASYFWPSLPPLSPQPLSSLSLSFLANALPANAKIRHAKKITRNRFIKSLLCAGTRTKRRREGTPLVVTIHL